jgi:hypothetical protein
LGKETISPDTPQQRRGMLMKTLEEIERLQKELVEKVQKFFQNPKRTKEEERRLYQDLQKFEKERQEVLYNNFFKKSKGEKNGKSN